MWNRMNDGTMMSTTVTSRTVTARVMRAEMQRLADTLGVVVEVGAPNGEVVDTFFATVNKVTIRVGRTTVPFMLRPDEHITSDADGNFIAEYRVGGRWEARGVYDTYEDAARALYVERSEFTASEGA